MRDILELIFLACIFILKTTAAFEEWTPRRCPKQGAAPNIPNSHCGSDPQIPCAGNSASDRGLWCQCDICTDPETFVPYTGVTRYYNLSINSTRKPGPDGYYRDFVTVNGQVPGPTIFADWGDEIVINVFSNLSQFGAPEGVYNAAPLAIHWHGINQRNTNQNDGVASLTQCPIAPLSTLTYRWRATQYGTAWYHSHVEAQAWDGVFGGIIINGPATADYDEDRGVLFLNDWPHSPTEQIYETVAGTGPQWLANGLINGTNIWNTTNRPTPNETYYSITHPHENDFVDEEEILEDEMVPTRTKNAPAASPTIISQITGHRFNMTVQRNKRYRLRLVDGALDTNFQFFIEGHNITVIAADMVPIVPYTTSYLRIAMGKSLRHVYAHSISKKNP